MRKVAAPIRLTVARNAPFRPRRSPITPKMIAPSGRKAKPAANNPSAAIRPAVGSRPAKKTFWIVVASEPKMKKSYHSKAVPADEAATTRFIDQFFWVSASAAAIFAPPYGCRVSGCGTRRKRLGGGFLELARAGEKLIDYRWVRQRRGVAKSAGLTLGDL